MTGQAEKQKKNRNKEIGLSVKGMDRHFLKREKCARRRTRGVKLTEVWKG